MLVAAYGAGRLITVLSAGAGAWPLAAHVGWMAFYAAAYLAIVLLLRARLSQFTPSLWLDGLIGLLTLGATGTALVLPQAATGNVMAGTCAAVHKAQKDASPVDCRPTGASPAALAVSSTS